MSLPTTKTIIVGVDYGTSKTCVSYALFDPENPAERDIRPLSFENGSTTTPSKTPLTEKEKQYWSTETGRAIPGYTWTKVLLDKNIASPEHGDGIITKLIANGFLRLGTQRTAPNVIQNFLRSLNEVIEKRLHKIYLDKPPLEFWFTFPAAWSEPARESVIKATIGAGYPVSPGGEVLWLSEAEAAALCLLDRVEPVEVRGHKNTFLVADCGGGTTDVTALSVRNTGLRYEYSQISAGTGVHNGGAEVDSNLLCQFYVKFGGDIDVALKNAKLMTVILNGVEHLKFDFSGEQSKTLQILQESIQVESGELRSALDPVVDRIVLVIIDALTIQDGQSHARVIQVHHSYFVPFTLGVKLPSMSL
ncbi:hypothetical protein BJX70DRAFT_395250 [Aspergillus crustosus]